MEDLQMLLAILPVSVREQIEKIGREDELLEVVLDLGRQPTARYVTGEVTLRESEVSQAEIDVVVNGIGDFDEDNRAGIARTLHRISAIRNRRGEVVGLTCRVGRAVYGTIDIIADIVEEGQSILLLGRPGVGKTTMLREMARILADRKRVIIVDTSNEIGGDGDIPHPAVGRARRMQVPKPAHQHEVMIEAVENHNPEVIIIDEIGREREAAAARTINERGVQLIGTAHGNTLENLLLNPTLSDLVGGIESVTLSDEEARRRGTQKTVLERRAPPTFDVLIEIQDRQRLAVHRDVAEAVDAMLRSRPLGVELRYRGEDGQIQIEREEEWKVPSPATGGRRAGREQPEPARYQSARARSDGNGRGSEQRFAPTPEAAPRSPSKTVNIFAYGVARNRLYQAAKHLGVAINVVDNLGEADILVTLKNYYRRQRKLIMDAQNRRTPVYVLRANTVSQMESFLAEALNLEVNSPDPFEEAIAEAERAIQLVQAGEPSVDLQPVGSAIRRYQHQLARQANLVSHSYGKGANRHVRIFNTPRN
ncbi:MAG: AAA family ATPase [Chloroflexi bacterium]|nr:AAA family ATPase [Chloroflexota bacterium]MCI0648122.1 AAA family ATPase [Chloroflexota bacterium]MCI0725456.1 AAA family ATPase [Chloroflexota bacterium]